MSDEDAVRYIKIFTLLDRETIEGLIEQHAQAPHLRLLQKRLAEEVTVMVHSREDYQTALEASEILFGQATRDSLLRLSEGDLLAVFEGVPSGTLPLGELGQGMDVASLAVKAGFLPSLSEARRALKENSLSVNKEKVSAERVITSEDLLRGRYLVLQRGRKNYFLLTVE